MRRGMKKFKNDSHENLFCLNVTISSISNKQNWTIDWKIVRICLNIKLFNMTDHVWRLYVATGRIMVLYVLTLTFLVSWRKENDSEPIVAIIPRILSALYLFFHAVLMLVLFPNIYLYFANCWNNKQTDYINMRYAEGRVSDSDRMYDSHWHTRIVPVLCFGSQI
jgi:hypothetical protein